MTPFFSIIIPTFNRGYLLYDSVNSVLSQDYEDFELIIVDDCSIDNTSLVVNSFNDRRLRYLKLTKNQGVSGARNYGIMNARGQYICFLDSDDIFKPKKLYNLHKLYEENKSEKPIFLFGGWEWVNFDSGKVRIIRRPDNKGLIDGLPRWCYNIVPDMVEQKFMQKNLFNPAHKSYEIYEPLIKIFKSGNVVFITEVISRFRDHYGSRVSSNTLETLNTISYLFQNYKEFIETVPYFCSKLMLTSGLYKKKLGLIDFRNDIIRSLMYNPLNLRSYYYFLKTFF